MNQVTKVMMRSLIINLSLSILKIISGILGASGALIADGIHSLSDMATDVFAIVGQKMSLKPADKNHPLGHGKIEYITSLGIGIVVFIMGITVIYNAIFNKVTIPSTYVLIVSLFVILVKIYLASLLTKKGREYENNILLTSGKESFTDVASSVIVFISILTSQLYVYNDIFKYADTVAMIIIGIMILKIAISILRENFSYLLGEAVLDDEYLNKLKQIIMVEEVINVDSLMVLKYGPFYHINCEVSMREDIVLKDSHDILEKIECNLRKYDSRLSNIIIHVNPKN